MKRSNRICKRCGEPADGYAQINDDWFCHPDDEARPDCYSLTRFIPVDEALAVSDRLAKRWAGVLHRLGDS